MKKNNTPKFQDIKGRKSVCHYDDDGKITHISIEESDEPLYCDALMMALNCPDFLRFRFNETAFNFDRTPHDPDEPFTFDEKEYGDIPEFWRRKNVKPKE